MDENAILLTENVIDIIKKQNAGQHVSQEELEATVNRFRELINANV